MVSITRHLENDDYGLMMLQLWDFGTNVSASSMIICRRFATYYYNIHQRVNYLGHSRKRFVFSAIDPT